MFDASCLTRSTRSSKHHRQVKALSRKTQATKQRDRIRACVLGSSDLALSIASWLEPKDYLSLALLNRACLSNLRWSRSRPLEMFTPAAYHADWVMPVFRQLLALEEEDAGTGIFRTLIHSLPELRAKLFRDYPKGLERQVRLLPGTRACHAVDDPKSATWGLLCL